jgi:hypothetical protein
MNENENEAMGGTTGFGENASRPAEGGSKDRRSSDRTSDGHDRTDSKDNLHPDEEEVKDSKARAKRAAALQSWDDICKETIPEAKVLISGLLMKGHLMALGSKSKQGKSWTLQNLGVCLATEKKWLGIHQCYAANVLYVNFEILKFNFRKRIKTVCDHLGVNAGKGKDLHKLTCWNLKGMVPNYKDFQEKLREALVDAGLSQSKFDCVIIDPWYRMAGGIDENSAGQVGDVLNAFESLAAEFDLAVIYIAHFSKGNQANKDAIDRISGSGVHGRAPDVIITFTPLEEHPDCYVVEYILRDFPAIANHTVRWNAGRCMYEYEPGVRPEVKKTKGRQKKFDLQRFVALLRYPMTSTEWANAALKEMEMEKASFDRYRREAIAQGSVVEVGNLYKKV